jgi:large subunit ribosomal protein L15
MKFKKRTKKTRFRGYRTHSRGGKKKARGSGHRGGFGMSGSGKRGDQKKTLILNLYGNDYFGKDKALRKPVRIKLESINLSQIQSNLPSFIKKGIAKQTKDSTELNLSEYKILATGDLTSKLKIKAHSASKSAIEKVKKSGGDIILA